MIKRRTFVLAGIGSLVALSTHGVRAIAKAVSVPQPSVTAVLAEATSFANGMDARIRTVVLRQALNGASYQEIVGSTLRPLGRFWLSEQELQRMLMRQRELIKEHPAHPLKYETQEYEGECTECLQDCVEKFTSQHATHNYNAFCRICDSKYRQTLRQAHANHRSFSTQCEKCLDEYRLKVRNINAEHRNHSIYQRECEECHELWRSPEAGREYITAQGLVYWDRE
jgi:hypothetical protein